jgi:hypothetical protein
VVKCNLSFKFNFTKGDHPMVRLFAVVLLSLSLMPAATLADTWSVPSDECLTIQAGIDSAGAGDTVLVAWGTYYEHDITVKSGICLRSETGNPGCATIDAADMGRVMECDSVDNTTTIQGFTIMHGNSGLDGGGQAVHCHHSSPELVNCILSENSEYGPAMVCADHSSPVITNCAFLRNPATVIYCTFGSSPSLTGCTFSGNMGEGLYCTWLCLPTLVNCTFFGNLGQFGNAMFCGDDSPPTIQNTIIAFGIYGPAIRCDSTSPPSLSCCDIYGNSGGDWVGSIADQYGVNGNISEDPLFCDVYNDDLTLHDTSPCAAENNPGCGQIGAWPVGCVTPGGPSTYLVRPDGMGDYPTIQAAISVAVDGDTIELAEGRFTGEGNRDIRYWGKAITVRSRGGNPDSCIIDCEGSKIDPHRGFYFEFGEGPGSALEGITIENGFNYDGGAIYCSSSSPDIADCILSGNSAGRFSPAGRGGGIACEYGSSPTVSNCTICLGSAGWGGALFCSEGSSPSLTGCTIVSNSSQYGSGICCGDSASATVENTIIAYGSGMMAIRCLGSSTPSLSCCDIYGNEMGDWVGSIADQYGVNGNISEDPLFCDAYNDDLTLHDTSPCAAGNNPGCGQIGAWPVGCVTPGGPSTYLVRPDGMGDYPTIQAAISVAVDGDTIELAEGRFTGEGNRDIRYWGKAITVRSRGGNPDSSIIDCEGSEAEPHCGFYFHSGEDSTSILEAITICNGNDAGEYYWYTGGGIRCRSSSPTLTDCVLSGNSGYEGGGMYCASCAPTLVRLTFVGNTARGGAGLACKSASPTLTSCTISGGFGQYGPCGILCRGPSFPVIQNTIIAFSTNGPAITCYDESAPSLSCCDIYGNSGGDWVGSIADQYGVNGNISEDPLFCDVYNDDLTLHDTSPCAAENNPGCGQIGAWPVGCVTPGGPSTYLVRPDGMGDYPTIQAAISVAVDGDTIELAEGRFTGEGNRDIRYWGKAITVRSRGGNPDSCIIDCEGSKPDPHCGFYFQSGEDSTSVLEAVTICNGHMHYGGGIYCTSTGPALTNCKLSANVAEVAGGGIYCNLAAPILTLCVLSRNSASGSSIPDGGGGAYCLESSPAFIGCTFSANSSDDGGGLSCCYGSYPVISGCVFAGNSAERGGALYYYRASSSSFAGCTLSHNSGESGSGISCYYSPLSIENTIIAFGIGGSALYCAGDSTVTLRCCDVYSNEGGDWVECIAGQDSINDNLSADPLFCDSGKGEFGLCDASPCASSQQATCGLIGAFDVGCNSGVHPDVPSGPASLYLEWSKPNPFTPEARITYVVPGGSKASPVRLQVYDPLGRLVRTLVDGYRQPGEYTVAWDGRDEYGHNVAPGVYFCRLVWNGQSLTRHVIRVE